MKHPALLFPLLALSLLAWLLVLNSPHEGVNASLHWDAEASITYGPNGTKPQLADARRHLYDCLADVRSDDPAEITRYYWTEPAMGYHKYLSGCRYYYSAVADEIGHRAFEWGRERFKRPVAAIWVYQATAAAAMAVALAGLVTAGVAQRSRAGVWATLLATAAVSSSPVFLSLSRQWLTETPGFFFFAMTLLTARAAFVFSPGDVDHRGRAVLRVLLAATSGLLAFATIRSRYTMGPALAIALPVVALLHPIRGRNWVELAIAFFSPLIELVVFDVFKSGPFITPGVYQDVMVRSSKLFFHADPPYDKFFVSVWENSSLLVVPPLLIWAWIATGRRTAPARAAGGAAVVIVVVLFWRTAAQQVQFQGRHLFPMTAVGIALMGVALPRVRWRPGSLIGFTVVALFLTVWNVCGSFGGQRRHETTGQADVLQVIDRHRSGDGAKLPRSLWRDLWWTNFVSADGRVLRDTLLVWNRVSDQNALVLIDAAADNANQFEDYARKFPTFEPYRLHGWNDSPAIQAARVAIAQGRTVYLLTAPGRHPPEGLIESQVIQNIDLHAASLRRVTKICPAGAVRNGGAGTSSADGITITRIQGSTDQFDTGFAWLPRVQREFLTVDTDPSAVAYRVDGLQPGHHYRLGVVTWDPDRKGRSIRVTCDGISVLSPGEIDPHAAPGSAPGDVTVEVSTTTKNIRIESASSASAVVCQLWIVRTD